MLLLILLLWVSHSLLACPSAKDVFPCICRTIGFHSSIITCKNIDNVPDLQDSVYALRTTSIRSFEILESTLNYLPHDLFQYVKFERLFIAGSTLVSLSDTEDGFMGLENSLQTFVITETHILGGWNWKHFKNLRKLDNLEINKGDLVTINKDINVLSHLNMKRLMLKDNHITWMHDYAFANLSNLVSLSLKKNEITEIKRSMFPKPATKLAVLILSNNQLHKLSKDIFTDMPALSSLYLTENKILTLDQETFSPVWKNLKTIDLNGIALRCDCRISWIVKEKFPLNMRGVCQTPASLSGKELKLLLIGDLRC